MRPDLSTIPRPAFWSRFPRRLPGYSLALLVAVGLGLVCPDLALSLIVNVLHAVWFIMHALIGWLELSIEHLLEWSLGVNRHTAQILTAWIGLFMILALLVWLTRKFMPKP